MICAPTRRAGLAVASAVTILLAVGCGDSDTPAADATTTTAATATTAAPTTATSAATTVAPTTATSAATTSPTSDGITTTVSTPAGQDGSLVELTVGGEVSRHRVELGEEVTIVVTGDATDEVHLHGYDLSADISPTVPATLVFVADIPGVFEIELEGSGTLLAELEVR